MKKAKYLVLTTALATMLMGAGYAAWTDKIETTTTINTGEFKMAVDSGYYGTQIKEGGIWKITDPCDLITGSGSVDAAKKSATFTFNNMYPGTKASTNLEMKNVGTVPAKIQGVKVTVTTPNAGPDGVADVATAMKVSGTLYLHKDGSLTNYEQVGSFNDITLGQLEAKMNEKLKGKYLNANDYFSFCCSNKNEVGETLTFEVPESLAGDAGEKEQVQVKIDFDFIQHNLYSAQAQS